MGILRHPAPGAVSLGSTFMTPLGNGVIHKALDMSRVPGDEPPFPIYSAAPGVVTGIRKSGVTYGSNPYGPVSAWCVTIDHPSLATHGIEATGYVHCSRIDVSVGDRVTAGQQIGLAGKTGGPVGMTVHLHFNVFSDKALFSQTIMGSRHGTLDPQPLIAGTYTPPEEEMAQADIDEMKADLDWIKQRIGGVGTSATIHESLTNSKGRETDTLHAANWIKARLGGTNDAGSPSITALIKAL